MDRRTKDQPSRDVNLEGGFGDADQLKYKATAERATNLDQCVLSASLSSGTVNKRISQLAETLIPDSELT